MNIKELAALVVEANADQLAGLPEPKVKLIIKESLRLVLGAVEGLEEGSFYLENFGQFKVRLAEVERDGQKQQVRRTVFQAGKRQPKTADAHTARASASAALAAVD